MVPGIIEFYEVFDAYHSELADLRERVDFRAAKQIASVMIRVSRAVAFCENLQVPGLLGESCAAGFDVLAALSTELVGRERYANNQLLSIYRPCLGQNLNGIPSKFRLESLSTAKLRSTGRNPLS